MKRIGNLLVILGLVLALQGCAKASAESSASNNAGPAATTSAAKVVFIELGSVNCIPCQAMQPVLDEIRQKYSDQVEVRFHDVWAPAGQPFGRTYGIRVIPTQIFLGPDGKEYFRH